MSKTLLQIWNEVGHVPFSARGTVDAIDAGRIFEVKRVEHGRAYGHFPNRVSAGMKRYRNAERPHWNLVNCDQVQNIPRDSPNMRKSCTTSPIQDGISATAVFFDEASDLDPKIFETLATKTKEKENMNVYDYVVLQKDPATLKSKLIKRDSIFALSEEKAKFAIILGLSAEIQADIENVDILIRPFK